MSLMIGTGPFGQRPAGSFSTRMPDRKGLMLFEDSPKRIRAIFAGETIVDSRRVKLLHEHGHLAVYYFPDQDVRADVLERSDHTTRCPHKGEATHWSVRVGDRVAANAVWAYLEPIESARALAGYRALHWDSMDRWLEEDEEAIVHPRDPYHRIDVLDTSRHVRVMLEGEVVADTRRSRVLFETGLPPRWYIPPDDVRSDTLAESDRRTGCAYKGWASYWSVRAGGVEEEDLVWTYPEPRHEAARIKGYVAFFNERADVEVDGELQERPQTQWSRGRRRAFQKP